MTVLFGSWVCWCGKVTLGKPLLSRLQFVEPRDEDSNNTTGILKQGQLLLMGRVSNIQSPFYCHRRCGRGACFPNLADSVRNALKHPAMTR